MLEIRPLDPTTDLELFREAYGWRSTKKHVQPDRAPFEAFIADDPRQIVIGVFNGQFCAAFLLYEWQPKCFEAHFTSKRGISKESLIDAGKQIRNAFLENGAEELCAWVTVRNKALKSYLEALGFIPGEQKSFQKNKGKESDTVCEMKEFVKYVYSGG